MNLQWIDSSGGPLVCASPVVAKAWRGVSGSSTGEPGSDYQRACDQADYVGTIACGPSRVIVLGDEPLRSAFAVKDEGVLVVRWVACVSNERAISAISQLPSSLPSLEAPVQFRLDDEGLRMFDSAHVGVNPPIWTSVNLEPGSFMVTTERYASDGDYEFLIHRLLRE